MKLKTTDQANVLAEDLFNEKLVQVFDKKSGRWLGAVARDKAIDPQLNMFQTPDQAPPANQPSLPDPNQISMFD